MKPVPLLVTLLMLSFCTLYSCSKGSGGGTPPPPPAEADLVVTTDPANGSLQPPALGPYYLKVSISSTLPPNGVKIEITAKKDDGSNTIFFTSSGNKTTPVNDFTITGTPVATQCLVEIKVTSLTKASNIWSGSYRYSSK